MSHPLFFIMFSMFKTCSELILNILGGGNIIKFLAYQDLQLPDNVDFIHFFKNYIEIFVFLR